MHRTRTWQPAIAHDIAALARGQQDSITKLKLSGRTSDTAEALVVSLDTSVRTSEAVVTCLAAEGGIGTAGQCSR